MEHLVEAVRTIAHRRNAEARLAILVVVDALRAVLDPAEVRALAAELPFELALILGRTGEVEPLAEELELLDVRTVHAVCSVLSLEGPLALRGKLTSHIAPRLTRQLQLEAESSGSPGALPEELPIASRPTVRVGRRHSTLPTGRVVFA